MAEETSDKKRPMHIVAASWLLGLLSRPGWPRRVVLAAAIVIFLVIMAVFFSGTDYKNDPAALATKYASFFIETRDTDLLLKNVGSWKLWSPARRAQAGDKRNQTQESVADSLGNKVSGLGTRLPLSWLTSAKMSAFALAEGEQDTGKAGGKDAGKEGEKSWILFLQVPNPASAIDEIKLERTLKLDPIPGSNALYELSGTGDGKLVLGAMAPWLMISSDVKLPKFAQGIKSRPSQSLAGAGLLPDWKRNMSVRGMADPAYLAGRHDLSPLLFGLATWIEPKARLGFTARVDSEGGVETVSSIGMLSEQSGGGGAWPLIAFLLFVLALFCLLVVLATLLLIIGWGGWLKAAAARAGIVPARDPAQVEPSPAFKEDAAKTQTATATATAEAADSVPAAAPDKAKSAPADEGDAKDDS